MNWSPGYYLCADGDREDNICHITTEKEFYCYPSGFEGCLDRSTSKETWDRWLSLPGRTIRTLTEDKFNMLQAMYLSNKRN